MKPRMLHQLALIAAMLPAAGTFAADDAVVKPAPSGGGATTIYRHVTADGRVVYSDKVIKGAKIDQTLTVEPPIKGNLWTTESGARPDIPEQSESTQVKKVSRIPMPGQSKTLDDAESDVIRAEMLLDDARQRKQAGVEPLPGERTGTASGNSRLNDAYQARQKRLAQDVQQAEAVLRQAINERNALQRTR